MSVSQYEHEELRAQLREMKAALLLGIEYAERAGHHARGACGQPACNACRFLREAKEALRAGR